MDLSVGARRSDLARLQAYEVGDRLLEKNPGLCIKYHFRESLGDRNQENPLWEMPEKGVFTRDFREALVRGEFDMVVHSWKDLPLDCDPPSFSSQGDDNTRETELIATLKRADSRDLLLFKRDHLGGVFSKKKICLFSSSLRRGYNLSDFLKTCFPTPLTRVQFKGIRGNILTRIRKLMEDKEGDGLIVAKAAIDRLLSARRKEFLENKQRLVSFLNQCLWQVLPLTQNPTAAGQGALAIEALSGRDDLKTLVASIHCGDTWREVCRERAVLKSYGGGCHQKIGVTCVQRDYGNMVFLRGETEKGETLRDFYWEENFEDKEKRNHRSSQQEIHGDSSMTEEGFCQSVFTREGDKQKGIHVVKGQWFRSGRRDYVRSARANAHFVARAEALPESEIFDPCREIVWVSGQKTWEKLARRGVWVHGSSESLGEREDRRIDLLAQTPLSWLKWTHNQAPRSPDMEPVATYDLVPDEKASDFSDLRFHRAFYWKSGSQFQWAVERWPELLEREHFCGPGNTFTLVREVLEKKNIKRKPKIIPMQWILEKEKSVESLSRQLFKRARAVSPGGVHSPVRSFGGLSGRKDSSVNPIFFKRARGPYLYSCDENRYVDFCQSFGPLILGHCDPDVSEAVRNMIQTAWTFGTCEPYSLDLAEWIVARIPHLEKLRFVNSGTEAVMSALRLARGVTGRHKVVKFEGHYHGHLDSLLVRAGSGLAGVSDSAGVSQKVASETLVLPVGDRKAVERAFVSHKKEIAAIIVEPLPANFGLLKQDNGFLRFLREITEKEESLLVFDEVISGFRVAWGGMAEISGVEPDLVTYGKIIGGGFPVGCYAGRRRWMDQVAPLGPVYQAGTLSANPVGMVAGLATLAKMEKENVIEKLGERTTAFVRNLESFIESCELPLRISHFASIFWIHNSPERNPRNIHEIGIHQREIFSRLFYECLKQRLYLPPSAYEVCFLSWSHDEQVLRDSCRRFKKAFEALRGTFGIDEDST